MSPPSSRWPHRRPGRRPWPLVLSCALLPAVALWTLPQTLVGLAPAAFKRLRGHRLMGYRFGPFLFLVAPSAPPDARGISLGVVVLAEEPSLLAHEFCHLYTALWLGWLYLKVFGLEYLVVGHDRSPHERLTCHFERTSAAAFERFF